MLISFTPVYPIKMRYWSAVINGVVAVPMMVLIMLPASSRKIMGKFPIPRSLKVLGWTVTGVMGAATLVCSRRHSCRIGSALFRGPALCDRLSGEREPPLGGCMPSMPLSQCPRSALRATSPLIFTAGIAR